MGERAKRPTVARAVESVRDATAVALPGDIPERLQTTLSDALRREGFRSLASDRSPIGAWFVGFIAKLVVGVGLMAAVVLWTDVDSVPVIFLLAALIWTSLEFLTFPSHPDRYWGINLYLGAWAAGGAWEASEYGMTSVAATHAAPVLGGLLVYRAVSEPGTLKRVGVTLYDALRKVPLAFPITMLILFAVMLTAEAWEAAHAQSTGRLAGLAALVIMPQLLILLVRLFKPIPDDFRAVAAELDAGDDQRMAGHAAATVERLRAVNGARRTHWIDEDAQLMLEYSFRGRRFSTEADQICDKVRGGMRVRIAVRLLVTVLGVGVIVFAWVYGLVVLAVSEASALKWSGASGGDEWILGLPGAPYVNIALLLAIVAAAVFLAFVVTGSDLVKNLSRDYVHEPAKNVLLFAVASSALAAAFPPEPAEPELSPAPKPKPVAAAP